MPFRTYRDDIPSDGPGGRGAPAAHGVHLHDARARRDRPRRASTSPGTSRSPSKRNLSERALSIRDDAFAQLGDTNLARPAGRREPRRTFTVSSRSPTTRAARGRQDRAPGGRAPSSVPCYLNAPGCPPGVAVRVRAGLLRAAAHPGQHAARELHVPDPARRGRRARRSCSREPSLYGHGLLGSATRDHRREHQVDGERAQLRVLRHRLVRHVDPGPAEHRARSSATCRTSRRCPTARSRGS